MCQLLVHIGKVGDKTNYKYLGSCSRDSAFDDSWKEEVDEQVNECFI